MRHLLILSTISMISFFSCKSESKNAKSNTVRPIHDSYMLMNQSKITDKEIATMRGNAIAILEKRKIENKNETFAILHSDIWVFGGLVSDSKSLFGDSLDGAWIDFKEDLTYEYGKYEEKYGSGQYYYNFISANLLLLDDNAAIKPQEFEVKMGKDMLVIVGNEVYKDNNMQAKLDRELALPSKSKLRDSKK